MGEQKIILPILARAWLQFDSQSAIWWIKEDCRCLHMITKNDEDKGKPCPMYTEENPYCFHINEKGKKIEHTLSKDGRRNKRNIERYNQYRMDLFHLAKSIGFQLQSSGMAFYYHYPVPVRWNKGKKAAMHGQMKESKPDVDNLNKGFFDALTGVDELVTQRSGDGKFWFRPELVEERLRGGYIEVLIGQKLHNPYGVDFVKPYTSVAMEDILVRREKLKARKDELKKERAAAEVVVKKEKVLKPLSIRTQKKLFKKEDKIK